MFKTSARVDKKHEDMVRSLPHWHHDFEIAPGLWTKGTYNPEFMLEKLQLPADLRGMRILDVGPSDGFFSMTLARRGADVTAVDYRDKDEHGFGVMERVSGLTFSYHNVNIYEINNRNLGKFDIILFLGVLYHLPDMLRALHILHGVCRGSIFVETEGEPDLTPGVATARYYEADTLNGDSSNFWAPNKECLSALLRDAGFIAKREEGWGRRLFVEATAGPSTHKMAVGYGLVPDNLKLVHQPGA